MAARGHRRRCVGLDRAAVTADRLWCIWLRRVGRGDRWAGSVAWGPGSVLRGSWRGSFGGAGARWQGEPGRDQRLSSSLRSSSSRFVWPGSGWSRSGWSGSGLSRTGWRRRGRWSTLLQGVEQPGFEFGGDVAVDVLDLVGYAVAEASGLDDVGDAVGDEPGFVAVPQPVEGQPAGDRLDRDGWLWVVGGAVGGGAQRAAAEVGAAQKRPVQGGEHVVVGVRGQMLAQQARPGTVGG